MNKRRFFSWIAVTILWLGMGAGCKKDPPEPKSCNDGTCCNTDKRRYIFDGTLNGEEADLISSSDDSTSIAGVYFKRGVPTDANYPIRSSPFCSLCRDKLQGFLPSASIKGPFAYKYRVWGRLCYDPDWLTFTATPFSYFYVDRIEKVQ